MALDEGLLGLAEKWSDSDEQAAIRRSISSAYYALFHHLASEAAKVFFPEQSDKMLHAATVRALDHRTMKSVCLGFAGMANHKRQVEELLCEAEIPEPLYELSRAFVDLQALRQSADYDIATEFTTADAEACCAIAREAFADVALIRGTPVFRLFLGALLFANMWRT